MKQGGTTANKTGISLQDFVEHTLRKNGYDFIERKKFIPAKYLEQPIYTTQLEICKSIYDKPLKCDFILYHPQKHPDCLVIECKWQQVGGSVDEKFPFLVLNIQTKSSYKTIVLLDGKGFSQGAINWLKEHIGNNLLNVYSMAEFQTWVNKGNL